MSHLKERTEKNCLNCNAAVEGRYCSICGQENLEPQESVWQLITHFFNDITHFDGKFFSSLKYLIFKPGFLTKEYVEGRRASYLNPVRMYIFTSFIFFFLFFGFFSEPVKFKETGNNKLNAGEVSAVDSARRIGMQNANDKDTVRRGNIISFGGNEYRDRKEYDSLRKAGKVDDNFFERLITLKGLSIKERYGNDSKRISEVILDNLKHTAPQIFFLSLPLLALVLKLLYLRRKKYYYVSHAIFSVHLFSFVYILTLLGLVIGALSNLPYLGWLSYTQIALVLLAFFYAYKAMRYFYEQRRAKTILKYIILLIALIVILILAIFIMLIYSFYKT